MTKPDVTALRALHQALNHLRDVVYHNIPPDRPTADRDRLFQRIDENLAAAETAIETLERGLSQSL